MGNNKDFQEMRKRFLLGNVAELCLFAACSQQWLVILGAGETADRKQGQIPALLSFVKGCVRGRGTGYMEAVGELGREEGLFLQKIKIRRATLSS